MPDSLLCIASVPLHHVIYVYVVHIFCGLHQYVSLFYASMRAFIIWHHFSYIYDLTVIIFKLSRKVSWFIHKLASTYSLWLAHHVVLVLFLYHFIKIFLAPSYICFVWQCRNIMLLTVQRSSASFSCKLLCLQCYFTDADTPFCVPMFLVSLVNYNLV